jgi:hypothetical protein
MGKLLQLIAKLFGKNAISKTLGTRTNVIKLPSNEKKRLIKDELNIEAASDLAAQKVLKEAEDLIADIPKMNDQEVLTFTGNLQRLDNKINPPSAEVLDLTTKKPVTGEGLEQLAARDGLPADVSPDSPIGRVMQGAQRLRKEKDELDKMLKDPAKQLEQEMQNPYRSGGPLDPKMGIVRTAARQVLQKLAREGKINIEDEREAKAIIEGYQGGVDPIEVFRKTFGQDALGDLANLGDELLEIDNRGGSFKDIKKILDDEGFFDLQQPKSPAQGMTDEELMKRIKSEDPEEFAKGGRVGFDDGGILSLEEAKKLNPGMFVDTTTYNPIPENAPNMAADEIAKVIMGTGFLPEEDDELGYPEGMEKPMNSKLFIFEEYVIPQRKKMMENFGLTLKEADDLIRQEMEKYRTNKATGGRVGFQIGGPAYDATDPIYGSSAITVTPDTIMGPQGNQIQAQTGVNPLLQRIQSGVDRAQNIFMNQVPNRFIDYLSGRTEPVTNLSKIASTQSTRDAVNQGILGSLKRNQVTNPIGAQNFLVKNTDYDGYKLGEAQKSIDASSFVDFLKKAAPSMGGEIVQLADTMLGSPQDQIANTLGDYTFQYKPPSYDFDDDYMGIKDKMDFPTTGFLPGTAYDVNVELTDADTKQKIREQLFKDPNTSDVVEPTSTTQPTFDRKTTIERILQDIENKNFQKNQIGDIYPDQFNTGLDLDYLKTLDPGEIKRELDKAYLQGQTF